MSLLEHIGGVLAFTQVLQARPRPHAELCVCVVSIEAALWSAMLQARTVCICHPHVSLTWQQRGAACALLCCLLCFPSMLGIWLLPAL